MQENLTDSQITSIREKAKLILLDLDLTQQEKVGYIIALSRMDALDCDHIPIYDLKKLLYGDWKLLVTGL